MSVLTPCNAIFHITLSASQVNIAGNNITVKAGLTVGAQYWYIVVDKFGKEYLKQFTADGQGAFEMLATDFPPALFNPYAGNFLVQIKRTLQDAVPVPLTFCAKVYDTIQMSFSDVNSDIPNAVVDCQ